MFAIVQRDFHDMDIAYTYFMLFLSFPVGLLVAAVIAGLSVAQVYLPGGLIGALITWPFFVAAGYAQWFILVPATIRWLKQPSNPTPHVDARDAAGKLDPPAARAGGRER